MQKTAVIFGGTGFIGRNIVKALAQRGFLIKVATRVPESAYLLKPLGDIGQINPIHCDYSDYNSIAEIAQGADYIINCVGILFERGKKRTFTHIHGDLAESIAAAAAVAKAKRLIHISALGADKASSAYAQSKRDGEERVRKAFPQATILRPSIVFGRDDDFFNKFAQMAQIMPFLPLIGGGHTKFQPVYVGDLAQAVLNIIDLPCHGEASPCGKIYELGGPDVLSFKGLFEEMFKYTQQPRSLVSMSFGLSKLNAMILSLLPTPLLTTDQVESLKTDNIVNPEAAGFAALNIQPTALDTVLPDYLVTYRPGGRFAA